MRPTLETLESRDCPGLAYSLDPWYGGSIAVAQYPVAPAGQQVVAMQDFFNVQSPFVTYHPTPLMPLPPASYNLGAAYTDVSGWQELGEFSVPQGGGDAFGYVDQTIWLAWQADIYSFETTDQFWLGWLANVQAGVAQANA